MTCVSIVGDLCEEGGMRALLIVASLMIASPGLASSQTLQSTVPFIGCPAGVQGDAEAPPRGAPKVVALDRATASTIAYYQGPDGQGPGVFAPRGWHCFVWSGSSGSTILVTRGPVDSSYSPKPAYGPGIELHSLDGGTSGRFGVATYASRLFPRVAATFIERVKREDLVPVTEFSRGPYLNDSIRLADSATAEFTTPGDKPGIGTEGLLGQTHDPIRGVAVLCPTGDWGLSILRMKVAPTWTSTEVAILKLNEDALRAHACD